MAWKSPGWTLHFQNDLCCATLPTGSGFRGISLDGLLAKLKIRWKAVGAVRGAGRYPRCWALSAMLSAAQLWQPGRLSVCSAHRCASACPIPWVCSQKTSALFLTAGGYSFDHLIVMESCVQRTVRRLPPKVPRELHLLKIRPQLALQEPGWKHSTAILCLVPYQRAANEGGHLYKTTCLFLFLFGHCQRLSTWGSSAKFIWEVVDVLSPEVFKRRLDGSLSNLV